MERFGVHRSLEPVGALPQQAQRVDTDAPLAADEVAIDVQYLNIDAASWTQIRDEFNGDADAIRARVFEIVKAHGKMHNPVTGSGGMLVGTVAELRARPRYLPAFRRNRSLGCASCRAPSRSRARGRGS